MKSSLAFAIALFAMTATSKAQTSSPPVVDAKGQEFCKAEVTPELKERIGPSHFQRSDRENTAKVRKIANQLSVLIVECLDRVSTAVEKNKDAYLPENLSIIRSYLISRRENAKEDYFQAMIRAGFRPSTLPPRHYGVCELSLEFPYPDQYITRSTWSPVFFDRESDNLVSLDISGLPLSMTAAAVIDAMRKSARVNHTGFSREWASCSQFDTYSDAAQWLADRLTSHGVKVAPISLPASATIPIP